MTNTTATTNDLATCAFITIDTATELVVELESSRGALPEARIDVTGLTAIEVTDALRAVWSTRLRDNCKVYCSSSVDYPGEVNFPFSADKLALIIRTSF